MAIRGTDSSMLLNWKKLFLTLIMRVLSSRQKSPQMWFYNLQWRSLQLYRCTIQTVQWPPPVLPGCPCAVVPGGLGQVPFGSKRVSEKKLGSWKFGVSRPLKRVLKGSWNGKKGTWNHIFNNITVFRKLSQNAIFWHQDFIWNSMFTLSKYIYTLRSIWRLLAQG